MKLNVFIITSLIILFSLRSYAQSNLTKTIIDSKTKLPVEYVYVTSDDKTLNLISNKGGQLILINNPKIKSYSFFKIGYLKKTILLENLLRSDTILLEEKPFNLQEVTVTAKMLDVIVKDKRYYVDDYKVLPNHDFLILTSKLNAKEFEVCYYKKDIGITYSKKIKSELNGFLFLDCFKNIHVVTDDFSRQVLFSSDSTFDFLPKYTRARYDSTIAQCVLNVDTQVVFTSSTAPLKKGKAYFDYKINSPYLNFISVSKHQRTFLYSVYYNKALREMVKYEDYDVAMRDSAFRQIGSRPNSLYSNENEAILFYTKVAKPIYAPIFAKADTIIVFNFQENIIVFLNKKGEIVKQVKIDKDGFSNYHDFEVICDPVTQKFYYKTKEFDKSGLTLMNIYTGKAIKKIHLEKIFAKNIQILDDKIYYLVREKEWDDTSYLYQQNL